MQQKNYLLFFVLSFILIITWVGVGRLLHPKPTPEPDKEEIVDSATPAKPPTSEQAGELQKVLGPLALRAANIRIPTPTKPVDLEPPPSAVNVKELVKLGDDDVKSKFHLFVEIDPRGAGGVPCCPEQVPANESERRPRRTSVEDGRRG